MLPNTRTDGQTADSQVTDSPMLSQTDLVTAVTSRIQTGNKNGILNLNAKLLHIFFINSIGFKIKLCFSTFSNKLFQT